ncbi:ASCH domain-containing protein [Ferdinandcohnia quinoae]|uniref:ASCH domain-containing protein n=1 Tax=Fredinandcohnia quinoae TaxID=2918902 RepID=A0AAW5DZ22_9BACI|nr:ASCH domain-containing protein [Fredinandcohnia sp. SECRCQ15]
MKKIDFWGRDEHDERLLEEVLRGLKTVTCTPKVWYDKLPTEEKGEIGDELALYTKKGENKGIIILTDIYEIEFGQIKGEIGERIAKGENSTLAQYIDDHIFCWKEPLEREGYDFNDKTIIIVEHFKLVKDLTDCKVDYHIVPMVEAEFIQIHNWLNIHLKRVTEDHNEKYCSVFMDNTFIAFVRFRQEDGVTYIFYKINPKYIELLSTEKDLVLKAEAYAKEVLGAETIILEWNMSYEVPNRG